MSKCNKCDEVCENETCLDCHMLKKHKAENDFKCDICNFSCSGLVTLRNHVITKPPHGVNQRETGSMNEAIKESLKKCDNKYEDDYKHKDSETPKCETPVVCELIGCCWCKYQV